VKRIAILVAVMAALSGLAWAESYRAILRAELVRIDKDSDEPSFHVVLINVRNPSGSQFEKQSARFDTVSISRDGETVRSNIFCDCGTSGPCGAPFRTINPGESASHFWDGRSDMCEVVDPGSYEISISRRCQDHDSLYRKICLDNPEACLPYDECFEYREGWRVEID
jgi:hypothetical protein